MHGLLEKTLDRFMLKVICLIVQISSPKDHILCILCFWCESKVAYIYLSYNEYYQEKY